MDSQVQRGAELEEMTWSVGPESKHKIMFQVHRGSDQPTWHGLEAKYKYRVHMPNMTSLRIDNLTLEDSGQYHANVKLTGGTMSTQKFHLIVYEPVPFPQMVKKSSSLTPDWCNVTLECSVPGPAEQNLSMTCKSKDLPTNLHPSITSGPGTNSWTFTVDVALSQPQSQPNGSIACVVSNSEDEKTVTFDLKDTCVHGQTDNRLLRISLGISVFLLMTLGAGLFLWNTHWKKKKEEEETRRGLQTDCRDDDGDLNYVEVGQQEAPKGKNKGIREQHLEEKVSLTTIYSEVCKPGQAMKIL
ncbi:uncharacterized protein LOC115872552 [Echinops telfairi]|uniref:Uncharacterized protein LOC115872552 n=1 Tax=Echinops telfairi TaxID=9371 RepID=A0AC55DRU4_ECHTE|nr:uncharacterized protein LOC115872552 [Echinops telfairi]